MIRQQLVTSRGGGGEPHFRWRGTEVSRLEGFSDGVCGFAVTLLVVSLEVPHTFAELLGSMRGFISFGVCFALLAQVWFLHYRSFRRYIAMVMPERGVSFAGFFYFSIPAYFTVAGSILGRRERLLIQAALCAGSTQSPETNQESVKQAD